MRAAPTRVLTAASAIPAAGLRARDTRMSRVSGCT